MKTPDRALAIGAHPDDVEFQCGATLAKWARGGCDVHVLVLTDGSKGSWTAGEDVAALVERRKREAQEAAGILGASEVHFLNYVDGELESGLAARAALCRVIRRARPDVVLGHDPWKRYRLHPDHRHAGFLTVDGVVAARDPHFFPEVGLLHHRPRELWLFEPDQADHWEPLVPEDVETKLAALLAHRSQWRSTMGIDDEAADATASGRSRFEERIRTEAIDAGRPSGLLFAEPFHRLETF